MRAPFLVALAAVSVLASSAVPVLGDHARPYEARSITFDHRGGNAWWVEVAVGGADAGDVVRVAAQDTGGAWTALTKRSWGSWAASFHVEPGHLVRFRATFSDGSVAWGCWFTHPGGVEHCHDGWPKEGSHVWYEARNGASAPDGSWWMQEEVVAKLWVQDGAWRGWCSGTRTEFHEYGEPQWRNTTVGAPVRTGPLKASVDTALGKDTTLTVLSGCYAQPATMRVTAIEDHTVTDDGAPVEVLSFRADESPDESAYRDWRANWDAHHGLLLQWELQGLHSNSRGALVKTDFPLG